MEIAKTRDHGNSEDGNGRISRLIFENIASKGLGSAWRFFCLSEIILKNRIAYYKAIEEFSGQDQSMDATPWILWNIDMAKENVDSLLADYKKTVVLSSFMNALDPSIFNSRELYMLHLLASVTFFGKLNGTKWMKMNKCSASAASRDIAHLVKEKLLVPTNPESAKTDYVLNSSFINERYLKNQY